MGKLEKIKKILDKNVCFAESIVKAAEEESVSEKERHENSAVRQRDKVLNYKSLANVYNDISMHISKMGCDDFDSETQKTILLAWVSTCILELQESFFYNGKEIFHLKKGLREGRYSEGEKERCLEKVEELEMEQENIMIRICHYEDVSQIVVAA